jgi:tRNA A37 threonylcarbamoyladenosine modification protein TsaB
MDQKIFHCGIVTSFVYTVIYIAENNFLIEYKYIKNIDFQKDITFILSFFFQKYQNINFISVFLGPAPLLSCRTTLIFIKGLKIVLDIKIIITSGNNLFKYSFLDIVIIQNFCGKYTLLEKNKINKTISLLELEKYDYKNKKIGLVAREYHAISINNNYITIIFPNINLIIKKSYVKYNKKNWIKNLSQLTPFL